MQKVSKKYGETLTIKDDKISISDEKDVTDFDDGEEVSTYAEDSVRFMKSIGLIEGYNNQFRPLDNLTRAEAATIIAKFIKNFEIQ